MAFETYDKIFFCFCLFDSFAAPSFTCFQMVVLFTSSVILMGFDGMINDIFAFEISISPGYGGGWSWCYFYRSKRHKMYDFQCQRKKSNVFFIQSHAQVCNVIFKSIFVREKNQNIQIIRRRGKSNKGLYLLHPLPNCARLQQPPALTFQA